MLATRREQFPLFGRVLQKQTGFTPEFRAPGSTGDEFLDKSLIEIFGITFELCAVLTRAGKSVA